MDDLGVCCMRQDGIYERKKAHGHILKRTIPYD
jgi:hypothetical protein